MQQVPTLRSLQRDTCLFDSGRPSQTSRHLGVYANGQSGLSFKQSPKRLCGFEPRHPCQTFMLAVAQLVERCTVNAESCGFESRRPTFSTARGVSQAGLRHATLYRAVAGSNPARPFKLYGAVAERLGTGLSIQLTRVRVSSVPPSSNALQAQQARAPAS